MKKISNLRNLYESLSGVSDNQEELTMNYWETVAGQELLNLIRMEVSRYSARKQYTIKTKLQNSEETLEKELAEGAKYVSSYQYKLKNIDYVVFILEK